MLDSISRISLDFKKRNNKIAIGDRWTICSKNIKLCATTAVNIEWEMTPDLAFCTFSAKGLRDDLINTNELVCYFFIDNWGSEPKRYFMERGVRHVNILAEIVAPTEMLTDSILNQGCALSVKDNYPVDTH